MFSEQYKQGITETLAILEHFDKEYIDKIPVSLLDFLKENSSKTYKFSFDSTKQIKDLKLRKETKGLLSMLYLYYWCEDKNEYINLLKENDKKLDQIKRNKYNPNNPFLKNNTALSIHSSVSIETNQQTTTENPTSLIKHKENFISKLFSKIKSFFKHTK